MAERFDPNPYDRHIGRYGGALARGLKSADEREWRATRAARCRSAGSAPRR